MKEIIGRVKYIKELLDTAKTISQKSASLSSVIDKDIFKLRKGNSYRLYIKLDEAVEIYGEIKFILDSFLCENGLYLIYNKQMSPVELELTVFAGNSIEINFDFPVCIVRQILHISEKDKQVYGPVKNNLYMPAIENTVLEAINVTSILGVQEEIDKCIKKLKKVKKEKPSENISTES